MGELFDYVKQRYNKKDVSEVDDLLRRSKVKNTIESLCDEYLVNPGDVFEFEVSPDDLQYAVSVLNEEPLKSKFTIVQSAPSLFNASLNEMIL